jgi:hypothetical protein
VARGGFEYNEFDIKPVTQVGVKIRTSPYAFLKLSIALFDLVFP